METTNYHDIAARIVPPRGAFIAGAARPAVSGRVFENRNPATGAVLGTVAHCDAADVDIAVRAARQVFRDGTWSRAAPEHRKQVLLRLADLVRRDADELATLESLDSGKTIRDCLQEIGHEVPTFFQWYAEAIDKRFGKVAPTDDSALALIVQ
jgi:aldehyde dehydrogenase (NAD+)/gamma-glutamyl-gamma-aminobutyraldehyde dehydrogenase